MRFIAFLPLLACAQSETFTTPLDAGVEATVDDDAPTFPVDGSSCSLRCSSDLHGVVDCNGAVVKSCPADQGCGANAECVPACAAAEDDRGSIGCEYYSVVPDTIAQGYGGCFAAFVANTWTSPVQISVERSGTSFQTGSFARIPSGNGADITYDPLPTSGLPPGKVAVLFLARFGINLNDCPPGVTPAYTAGSAHVLGTGKGHAFHITTSRPIVAYDVFPYGGGSSMATSSTLLLPTSAWDTNYIAVNPYRKSGAVGTAQPSLDIVATEGGTTVTILPNADIVGGAGVSAATKGAPVTYPLAKGDILQISQNNELTGSVIQTNKPVGLWGAASCLNIDVNDQACDSAHQQIPPVRALGHEYVAVRHRNRTTEEESPPWRFVGAVGGTTLTYDPAPPAGAPLTLAAGELKEFSTSSAFVVRSQDKDHPFYVSGHMTGGGKFNGIGDPEFVNVIPAAQYRSSYVFFTDPTYAETNLIVVRTKASALEDVTLDCAGKLTGWQPIGIEGRFEYTRINLVSGNFEKQNGCDNGVHTMSSAAPFGVTVWGWGSPATGAFNTSWVSYAYPAGANVHLINDVVIAPK